MISKTSTANRFAQAAKCRQSFSFVAIWLAMLAILPLATLAHPLGNFTVNHFSRLQINRDRIILRYIVDMAEIPAFQTLQALDADNDGTPSAQELQAYVEQNAARYAEGLALTIDDSPTRWQPLASHITTPAGSGGLPTLRLEYEFAAMIPSGSAPHRLRYEDRNDSERAGWHEIVIAPNAAIAVFDSTAFANGLTDELKAYPDDRLAAPLNERQAVLSFANGVVPEAATALMTREGRAITPARDRFAELIAVKELTIPVALLGLLIAMFLGGVHAMSPGHGKTVVGAYLVGSRGTAKHAAFLGLTVTVTHTLGVFALGFITLFASHYIVPEKLFPIISVLSGLIVFGLGASLLLQRLRVAFGFASADHHHTHDHEPQHHAHDHKQQQHSHGSHDHTHQHSDEHMHDHNHSHDHTHQHSDEHTHDHEHSHAHLHEQQYAHQSHTHEPQYAIAHAPSHHLAHDHTHSHEALTAASQQRATDNRRPTLDTAHQTTDNGQRTTDALIHSHDGGKPHSHLPPGIDGSKITWKSLLALGISGGLLPCPSALVVLLSAIALHRVGYGLLLVIAFSFGLAATLTGVGLMFLYAGKLLKRPANAMPNPLVKWLPVLSALFITCAGAVICYQALMTNGLQ